jgi:Probable cobalt transporter subunit (CbtA)
MARSLLVRGMLVGLAAGVLAFAFAFVFGEPQVQKAIDFEEQLARIHHESPDPEIVSRGVQRTLGLLTGTTVLGVALGGMFSLAFAGIYGRVSRLPARITSALLALAAFTTVTLVPATKYPPNPPTVGNAATIDRRTLLYFAMIAISVLAAVAATRVRRDLLPRLGAWNAGIAAAGAFVALIAVAELILPGVREVPAGFPADVLWHFRIASLGTEALLWATIGLGFGAAAERLISARPRALAAR